MAFRRLQLTSLLTHIKEEKNKCSYCFSNFHYATSNGSYFEFRFNYDLDVAPVRNNQSVSLEFLFGGGGLYTQYGSVEEPDEEWGHLCFLFEVFIFFM